MAHSPRYSCAKEREPSGTGQQDATSQPASTAYESHKQLMNIRSLTFFNNRDFLQRSFQIELYEICKSQDTVVCLRSGYAKQFFTVMLVKNYSQIGKTILFVSKTDESLLMYGSLLRAHSDLNIVELMNTSDVQQFFNPNVAFQWPGVILLSDTVCEHLLSLRNDHPQLQSCLDVNLVIFDQVHETIRSIGCRDAYSNIATYFREKFQSRILGLSASIITEGVKMSVFKSMIDEIESQMGCVCETYADLKMINKYSVNARIALRFYPLPNVEQRWKQLSTSLDTPVDRDVMERSLNRIHVTADNFLQLIGRPLNAEDETFKLVTLEALSDMIVSVLDVFTELGEWCALKLSMFYLLELDDVCIFLTGNESEYLTRVNFAVTTLRTITNHILLYLPPLIRGKLRAEFYSVRPKTHSNSSSGFYRKFGHSNNSQQSAGQATQSNTGGPPQLTPGELLALSTVRLHLFADSLNSYLSEMNFNRSVLTTYSFPDNVCGIVYASTPARVRALVAWIQEVGTVFRHSNPSSPFGFLQPEYVFLAAQESENSDNHNASSSSSSATHYYNQHQKSMHEIHYYRRQEETLKHFRFGHGCNMLCTTSMNIDGLDVFRCSFVFCFDPLKSLSDFVRAKGRMRLDNGKFTVLAANGSNYENVLGEYLKIERLFTKLMPVNHTVDFEASNQQSEGFQFSLEKVMPAQTSQATSANSNTVLSQAAPSHSPQPTNSSNNSSDIRLTMENALSILNRYCTKLPSDIFTRLSPNYQLETFVDSASGEASFQCSLNLPINSVFRDKVVGDRMDTKIKAKRSAAYKAVQILLKIGELDSNFYPYRKEMTEYIEKLGLQDCFNNNFAPRSQLGTASPTSLNSNVQSQTPSNVSTRGGRAGGRGGYSRSNRHNRLCARAQASKRRNIYPKRITPLFFGNCFKPTDNPDQFEVEYLYEFLLELSAQLPEIEAHSAKIGRGRPPINPAHSSRNIAIISPHPFPSTCGFTVYNRSGEITVNIRRICNTHSLLVNREQIEKLRMFHFYIFENALRFGTKMSFVQNFEESASGNIVVVPVNHSEQQLSTIDWEFVDKIAIASSNKQHSSTATSTVPTNHNSVSTEMSELFEDGQFKFVEELYLDAVVVPKYRREKRYGFFYVAKICHNMKPHDHFPDGDYGTFENYYRIKYGLNITNKEQPLLDVDHTSSRLNLLIPRYLNRRGFKSSHRFQYDGDSGAASQDPNQQSQAPQQKQLLLPELCLIHPIPASFWRKMEALPSILYRINSLLISEEFRARVAREAKIGIVSLPEGKTWPNLDFGWPKFVSNSEETGPERLVKPVKSSSHATRVKKLKQPSQNKPALVKVDPPVENVNDAFSAMDNWTAFEKTISIDSSSLTPSEDEPDDVMFSCDELPLEIIGFSEMCIKEAIPEPANEQQHSVPLSGASSLEIGLNLTTLSRDISRAKFDSELDAHMNEYFNDPGDDDDDFDYDQGNGDEQMFSDFDEDSDQYSEQYSEVESEESDDDFDDDLDENDEEFDVFNNPKRKRAANSRVANSAIETSAKDTLFYQTNWEAGVNCHRVRSFIYDYLRIEMLYDWRHYEQQLLNQVVLDLRKKNLLDSRVQFFGTEQMLGLESESARYMNAFDAVQSLERQQVQQIIDSLCKRSHPDGRFEVASSIETGVDTLEAKLRLNIPEREHRLVTPQVEDVVPTGSSPLKIEKTSSIDDETKEIKFGELLPDRGNERIKVEADAVPQLFSFDASNSEQCFGPDPSIILQAITMSNSADGINLERLETVGDSFLKYSVTAFLFVMCPDLNEGKLSFLRSRQISNLNLHRLGQRINLGELMITSKFDPNDNWCPPGYRIDESKLTTSPNHKSATNPDTTVVAPSSGHIKPDNNGPYNIFLQHSIRHKSIADCVEALIGTYLISSGTRAAVDFMDWLGLRVRPKDLSACENGWLPTPPSALLGNKACLSEGQCFDDLRERLDQLYAHWRLDEFEKILGYTFRDRALLVQAFTHNSYYENSLTDCYQRLEFLGDAVLDYLITRYLYEDPKCHSPGALTDLRSALVNNTFFASLAVKYNFHKYLLSLSPELFRVIDGFVCKFNICNLKKSSSTEAKSCDENPSEATDSKADSSTEKNTLNLLGYWEMFVSENETEHLEDIEVPKALGDIFESVAGAIFLDSGMSLSAVWNAYYPMMKPEIDYFSFNVPKSPIRVLLEMHPHVARFGKPEVTSGRKIRIVVNVNDIGQFIGVGRNKRIAKCTAAKRALRALKLIEKSRQVSTVSDQNTV